MLAGMWVNTIVLSRPIFFATQGAASCEAAVSSPDQKKKAPAAVSDRPKRWNSQSESRAFTTRPPAKASSENKAASRSTIPREGPSGSGGAGRACGGGSGRRR